MLFSKCVICQETQYVYTYKLQCGHSFHSSCIINWFRTKNTTCPICRYETATKKSNEYTDLERHKDVIHFLSSSNPSKEIIIKAYTVRNEYMNISFENVLQNCVLKLRLDPNTYDVQILHQYSNEFKALSINILEKILTNRDEFVIFDIATKFNDYLKDKLSSQQYIGKKRLYDSLNKYYKLNDIFGFYNSLSINELHNLGW